MPRREPYWERLGTGRALGFRKLTANGGTWIAKLYDGRTLKKDYHALGDFAEVQDARRYDAAKQAAEQWFEHLNRGGQRTYITVVEAGQRYVDHLRRTKGDKPADDAQARFARYVDSHTLGALRVDQLQHRDLSQWRKDLESTPTTPPKLGARCRATEPAKQRPRSASTINCDMTSLRAALNMSLDDGYALTDLAWRKALPPVRGADNRRDVYLDRDQRRALIAVLPDDLAAFATGLCQLPLRPGALAGLRVLDFDGRRKTLRIGVDKAGKDRRILVPDTTAGVLTSQAGQTAGCAPVCPRRWLCLEQGRVKEASARGRCRSLRPTVSRKACVRFRTSVHWFHRRTPWRYRADHRRQRLNAVRHEPARRERRTQLDVIPEFLFNTLSVMLTTRDGKQEWKSVSGGQECQNEASKPVRKKKDNTDRDAQIIALCKDGKQYREVGKLLGISKSVVHRVMTKANATYQGT